MRKLKALGRIKARLSANAPGITVAVIAMLLALTGAAFAASGALTGKQKKEVKALIKKEAKPGSPGAPGAKGDPGAPGAKGDPGAPGASVKVTSVAEGDPEFCAELGGAIVEKEGNPAAAEVCSGEDGAPGAPGVPGKPWTADGPRPAEGQVMGTWIASGTGSVEAPLSFPIHLGGNVKSGKVWFGTGDEEPIEVEPGKTEPTEFKKHCLKDPVSSGSMLKPEVAPGFTRTLCIFHSTFDSVAVNFVNVTVVGGEGGPGAGTAGGFLEVELPEGGVAHGSFAVRGGE